MSYYVDLILNILFTLVPVLFGWIRFPNINPVFYPFFFSVWLNGLNLTIGGIIAEFGYYNTTNYNIWFLLDAYISLWIFEKWNLFESKQSYQALWMVLSVFWLIETVFFSKLTLDYNSYFRMFYCFIIILMSISTINSLLIRERKALLKNPVFIICCTFVFFNSIIVLAEAFFASNLQLGDSFRINMERIILFAGLLCNLIYTIAILLMPKKQAFILQY